MPVSAGELATRFGCELIGDPDVVVAGVASLGEAAPDSLTFLSNSALADALGSTQAGAAIVRPADASSCPVTAILSDDPYATYARMAAVVCPPPEYAPGIHPSAVVSPDADVDATAHIAAHVVIDAGSRIGAGSYVGPGSVIGPDCRIGDACRLVANVTLVQRVAIGARAVLHPGVVLGSDGFGNAMTPEGWIKVPQLGGVRIGDDVEIGAGTTVDCGAIGDTIIDDGVRIDNLCMIAHNVLCRCAYGDGRNDRHCGQYADWQTLHVCGPDRHRRPHHDLRRRHRRREILPVEGRDRARHLCRQYSR